MILPSAAVLLLQLPYAAPTSPHADPQAPKRSRDPRTQPLTVADALFTLPGVTGAMRLVDDLDGDGREDLVVEWNGASGVVLRIDALSTLDGHLIRKLWSTDGDQVVDWDVGGDANGDRVPDLLVAMAPSHEICVRSATVLVVSGADGTVLRDSHGLASDEQGGWSVAFLDDLDGDGCCEYAVGAPQCETGSTRQLTKQGLERRSTLPGRIRAHSGRDGRMLWEAHGERSGHAWGVRMRAIGDVDGDGHFDLLIGPDPRSSEELRVVSGRDGTRVGSLPNNGGPFGVAGDVDGDGAVDLFVDRMHENCGDHSGSTSIVSVGKGVLFELPFPDWASPYSTTIPLEDVDGDGVPDFLLGDANFDIPAPSRAEREHGDVPIDLDSMSLAETLALESDPWCAMTWESGAAWVYSGRTRRVILGAWGLPGSREGMGLAGAPIPDVDGDGFPEIVIADSERAYVFRGPGRDPHAPK